MFSPEEKELLKSHGFTVDQKWGARISLDRWNGAMVYRRGDGIIMAGGVADATDDWEKGHYDLLSAIQFAKSTGRVRFGEEFNKRTKEPTMNQDAIDSQEKAVVVGTPKRYFYVRPTFVTEGELMPWVAVEANGICNHVAAVQVLGRPYTSFRLDRPIMVEVLYSIRTRVIRPPRPRQEGINLDEPTHEDKWYRSINDFIVGPGSRWFWTHVSDLPAHEGIVEQAKRETST